VGQRGGAKVLGYARARIPLRKILRYGSSPTTQRQALSNPLKAIHKVCTILYPSGKLIECLVGQN